MIDRDAKCSEGICGIVLSGVEEYGGILFSTIKKKILVSPVQAIGKTDFPSNPANSSTLSELGGALNG